MGHDLTREDREKLIRLKNQNSSDNDSDIEYETVEGYEHLEVLRAGERYNIEYNDVSINIYGNRVHKISLSNFLEDYLDTENFDEAHRQNYKSKGKQAQEFHLIFEAGEDLTKDLSKLAEELDPRD